MARKTTTDRNDGRARAGLWFVLALAVLLLGYPVGFMLLAGQADSATFTLVYVLLAALVLAAAFGAARSRGRSIP